MNQPMDSLGPDDLDRLLQTWAAGRQPSAERLTELEKRIAVQLADQLPLTVVGDAHASGHVERRPRARLSLSSSPAWFLAGAAASVALIVAGSFWFGGNRSNELPVSHPGAPELPAGYASLTHDQLLAKARLFAEMQTVFGGQLDWIAETTDHIELGLAKEGATSGDDRPLTVRVVVERRAPGATEWKIVWATDVIARDQETVVLRSAKGTAPVALSLWAYRLPDGTVFVESDLTLSSAGRAIHSASSNILQNNRAVEVGSVDADGAQYRVFQTAAALDGDLG